jgi:transcriptional regulator with XRE-family HTH domain
MTNELRSRCGPKRDPALYWAMASRIRARREALGLGQKDVAHSAGCSRPMIAFYESGRCMPGISVVAALCRALQFTPNDLFGWEEVS